LGGKSPMDNCHLCGAQTEYYRIDLPTCLACSAGLTAKPKPTTLPRPMSNDVQLSFPTNKSLVLAAVLFAMTVQCYKGIFGRATLRSRGRLPLGAFRVFNLAPRLCDLLTASKYAKFRRSRSSHGMLYRPSHALSVTSRNRYWAG